MRAQVDAAGLQALQIELLHFVGRRLEDDLELLVLEEPVRVLAEAAVGRPARRLDVGDAPGFGVVPEAANAAARYTRGAVISTSGWIARLKLASAFA